jgi:hypothetical protein
MNGKLAKRIRKEAKMIAGERIKGEMFFLDRAFKPKPKWLPVWLWRNLAKIYFKDGYFVFEKSDRVKKAVDVLKKQ